MRMGLGDILSSPVSLLDFNVFFVKLMRSADTGIGMTPEELTNNLVRSHSHH
jgi:hypothetical protein